MKKISVLMLTYNHAPYIKKAIDSVLMQKTKYDYEIIIGDDCSTDGTVDILVEYRNRYPNKIKLLLENENKGIKHNVIKTYNACNGEYIAWLEGDDYWLVNDKLEKQVEFLDNNLEYSTCFSRVEVIYENDCSKKSYLPLMSLKRNNFDTEYVIKNFFIPTLTVMHRKEALPEIPKWFDSINILFDYPMNVLRSKYGKYKMFDEIMGVYRKHDGGVTNRVNYKWRIDHINIYKELNKELDYKYNDYFYEQISQSYLDLGLDYVYMRERDRAKLCVKEYKKYSSSANNIKKLIFLKLGIIFGKPMVSLLYEYRNFNRQRMIKKSQAW